MNVWEALVLGVVEGITEYLPVSSTGHLLLAQRALGIEGSVAANAYAIVIQAGAIAAVLGLYRRRVASMGRGLLGQDAVGRRLLVGIVVAFLPAAVLGLLFGDAVQASLFGLWWVVAAWAVGGLLILAFRGRQSGRGVPLEHLTFRMAAVVGVAQCLAFWPGMSRSLVTIAGGLVAGLELVAAVELSFLLGVVTLTAATAWTALGTGHELVAAYELLPLGVGFVAAWAAAAVAVGWLVRYLTRHGLAVFGWYRLVLAAVVAVLLAVGSLAP